MKKTNYKALAYGAFLGKSLKSAGACFWPLLGLAVFCFLCIIALAVLSIIFRAFWFAGIIAALIIPLYYVAATKIVGSRLEETPEGVFASLQSSVTAVFHFIIAAVLMSVPISLLTVGLYYAGVKDQRVFQALDVLYMFPLLYAVFVLPAVSLREQSFIEGFKYSFSLVKNNYWKTFGYLGSAGLIAATVWILFWLVVVLAAMLLGVGLYAMAQQAVFSAMAMQFSPLLIAVEAAVFLVAMILYNWLISFFYSAYVMMFLKLEGGVYAGPANFAQLSEPAPLPIAAAAAPAENPSAAPEENKFYKEIFEKKKEDSPAGEMPTLYVDMSAADERDIDQILQRRMRERESRPSTQTTGTVSLSDQDMEIKFEETEYLPEKHTERLTRPPRKEPLPPAEGPVEPRLKVVNVPPPPPFKNEEEK